jgi:Cu(I)/Ag(I) efflux system protein CusF
MKAIRKFLLVSAMSLGVTWPLLGAAQAMMDQGKSNMSDVAMMTDGEVRKVDQGTGKVTIKHGDIKHLDMPGMTMVFTAKNKSVLNNIKPGDKVKFMAVTEGGKFFVTDIQPEK